MKRLTTVLSILVIAVLVVSCAPKVVKETVVVEKPVEKVVEKISFEGPDLRKKTVKIDAAYVREQLSEIVKDQDLSRYIL